MRLWLNGDVFEANEELTLLEACRAAGVHVPHLCHDPRLSPLGTCRLCCVEVEGIDHPLPACATAARDGMRVATHTPALEAHRSMILSRLASHADGAQPSALLDELRAHGVAPAHVAPCRAPGAPRVDDSHPYLHVDMARCIACRACEQICRDLQGQNTWQAWGRGALVRLVPDSGSTLRASSCVSCGACADACPTGAIVDRQLLDQERPARWTRTTCPYCGVGCELSVGTRADRIVAVRPVIDAPVNKGHLCVKGRYAFGFVDAGDRLRSPLIRERGVLRPASWEEALAHVARELTRLQTAYGADALAVLGSARATNEENYLTQKFARVVLGTNNVDCCARVCHAPSAAGLSAMLGTGAATNSFEDIERAKTLLVIGANATESHPVVGARIRQAARRGARLIVIDPRGTELAREAELHLAVTPGADVSLLNAMAWTVIEEGLWDREFLAHRVSGLEELRVHLEAYRPELAAATCGVEAAQIRRAARLYATATPSMALHGLGVTEHVQGTDGVMAIVNLALLTGNVGRIGSGVNPLRGQNNVQGAAHMGCEPAHLTGYAALEEARARFEKTWGVKLPDSRGLDLLEMIDAAQDGALKALYAIGYDVLLTNPDAERTRAALARLELLVVQDLFLTELGRELAHVVLPAASAFEKEGTFMNAERRVQRVRRAVAPRAGARSDQEILCALGSLMGHADAFSFPSAEAVWDEVRSVWPAGAGMTYARLDQAGLQWPCPSEAHAGTTRLHEHRFACGERASLRRIAQEPVSERTDADYPFVLITGRKLYQFNAGTMTQRTANSLLQPEDELHVSEADAERLKLTTGDEASIRSRWGAARSKVRVDASLRSGELFATFHTATVYINRVTNGLRDARTHTPAYKRTAVALEKIEE